MVLGSRLYSCVIVCLCLAAGAVSVISAQQQDTPEQFVTGEVLVQFRTGVSESSRSEVRAAHAAVGIRRFDALRVEQLTLPANANPVAVARALAARPEVESAQPNFIRRTSSTAAPNDPYFVDGTLWGLTRISAPLAWAAYGAGGNEVVVADIDTGVDYTHPDLAPHMWRNPGEIAGNSADDDGNGYVDDVVGIDTFNHDSDPADDHGHGTHTAGTIGAVPDNGLGVAGVAVNAKILACKFISSRNSGTDAGAIECFNYVVALKNRGVNIRVTSNSWGGRRDGFFPTTLKNAIDAAGNAGIVNVFAAGNDGIDTDVYPFDPASLTSPSIVSVAASDSSDGRAWFSNYGAVSVDLAAPGVDILSTYPGGFAWMSGTSMATPHVAGAAAFLLSHQPSLTVSEVKDSLLNNVDPASQWNGVVATGGRLNAMAAMTGNPVGTSPTVALTSPVAGSAFTAPASITITATASDSDDGVTNVEFLANGVPIGSSSASPYSVVWNDVAAGSYSLTAVATDAGGRSTTSAAVMIEVTAPVNAAPDVRVTSPASGTSVVVGSLVTLAAVASDGDGISRVDFYSGSALIVSATTTDGSTFSAQWRPASPGNQSLTARAYDTYGASATSAPVRVNVKRK